MYLAAASLFITTSGTVGFKIIGGPETTWFNCLYMTIITLTTVGFGEIVDMSHKPYGRLFTMFLLVGGMGLIAYTASTITEVVVEGVLQQYLRRRKTMKQIDSMSGHVIVAGFSKPGEYVVAELLHTNREVVLVDLNSEKVQAALVEMKASEIPVVIGDAMEEEVLLAAGIERALGLVTTVSSDKENMIITHAARELDKNFIAEGKRTTSLRIIARAIEVKNVPRIKKLGADSVISPSFIGGLRMVSEMVRPTVVTFLDKMLRDKDKNLRVEEVGIPPQSRFHGKKLRDVHLREIGKVLLLAIQLSDGEKWIYNPDADFVIESGMTLIIMGDPAGREKVEEASRAH
jgi:voltage-gated potassium channel